MMLGPIVHLRCRYLALRFLPIPDGDPLVASWQPSTRKHRTDGRPTMNDTGRLLLLVHTSRREDDWRSADAWRRLHARPDALPLPAIEPHPSRSLATLRRLLPRHA